MNKKVAVMGTYGKVPGCSFMDTPELLSKVGANSGNLAFQYSVLNSIAEEKLVVGVDVPWIPELVREQCRVLVIPSANFIRENFDFSGVVNFVDKVGIPIVVLGLGVQADNYEKSEFNLHPSIVRLLDLLRERCQRVSLRGEFSAKVLEKFGVKNTVVTGCPSNFLNPDPSLPIRLKEKWGKESRLCMATGDEPWPKNLAKRDAERKLIRSIWGAGGVYVQQSVDPFVRVIRAKNTYQNSLPEPHHAESLRKSIAPDLSPEEFDVFLATRVRLYFDVDQWLEEASRFDLSIGLRLHGNMISFQSGTPAIWIYHDSRTRELAETMELPRIDLDTYLKTESIAEVKEKSICDFDKYAARRESLRKEYVSILQDAGISVNERLMWS